jgi:hypothetical protein
MTTSFTTVTDGVTPVRAALWTELQTAVNDLETITADVSASDLTKLSQVTATSTELNYVDNVTSAIQTQMDLKAPLASPTFTGTVILAAVQATGDAELDGALNHDGTTVGFYGTAPTTKQTGVAVTAEAIHAALVALGLIGA